MSTDPLSAQQSGDIPGTTKNSKARPLNLWMYNHIRPYLREKIMEIGSGDGRIANLLIERGHDLRISDPDKNCCSFLQSRFKNFQLIKGVHRIDPTHETFEKAYEIYLHKFDTILCLNKTEAFNNNQVVINIKKLLTERGYLILHEPVRIALFNESVDGIEQWRQENQRHLKKVLGKDMQIIKTRLFSILEMGKSHPSGIYHQFVTYLDPTEENVIQPTGLSMFAVARQSEIIKNKYQL